MKIDQIDSTVGTADDVVVNTKSEEPDKILHKLMQVARKNNLVFNSTKCIIRFKIGSFYSMTYSGNGISPDPEKINDLSNTPSSTCKKELQEFLGLFTNLSPLISNLHDKTYIL